MQNTYSMYFEDVSSILTFFRVLVLLTVCGYMHCMQVNLFYICIGAHLWKLNALKYVVYTMQMYLESIPGTTDVKCWGCSASQILLKYFYYKRNV